MSRIDVLISKQIEERFTAAQILTRTNQTNTQTGR